LFNPKNAQLGPLQSSSLPHGFSFPPSFSCPLDDIKVIGVPFGFASFLLFLLQVALDEDVQHIETLLMLGDV
jgi:hypothetical protein